MAKVAGGPVGSSRGSIGLVEHRRPRLTKREAARWYHHSGVGLGELHGGGSAKNKVAGDAVVGSS